MHHFTENLVSTDYTNEPDFLGDFNKWCIQAISTNQMNLVSGSIIGTKDSKGNAITPEMILGENYLNINDDIEIPIENKIIKKKTSKSKKNIKDDNNNTMINISSNDNVVECKPVMIIEIYT